MTVSKIEIQRRELEYLFDEDISFDLIKNEIYYCQINIIGFESVLLEKLKPIFYEKTLTLNSSISESLTLPNYVRRNFFSYKKILSQLQKENLLKILDTLPKYFLFALLNEIQNDNRLIIINSIGLSLDSLTIILKKFLSKFKREKTFIILKYEAEPCFKFFRIKDPADISKLNIDIGYNSIDKHLWKMLTVEYRNRDSLKRRFAKSIDCLIDFIKDGIYALIRKKH